LVTDALVVRATSVGICVLLRADARADQGTCAGRDRAAVAAAELIADHAADDGADDRARAGAGVARLVVDDALVPAFLARLRHAHLMHDRARRKDLRVIAARLVAVVVVRVIPTVLPVGESRRSSHQRRRGEGSGGQQLVHDYLSSRNPLYPG